MKSTVEVSKVFSSPDYKVVKVAGGTGDVLDRHKVDEQAFLLVKKGCITYKEDGASEKILYEDQGQNIPANIFHEVYCNDTSEVFLLIPLRAKIKFER